MKPTEKHPELAKFLDDMTEMVFGNLPRSKAIHVDKCVDCGGKATAFTDDLSLKEFSISGLCQACQDKLYEEK